MKFYIPDIDGDEAERAYGVVSQRLHNSYGELSPKRYYSVFGQHNGKATMDEVGKPDARENSKVLAIFYSKRHDLFLVCTEKRGFYGSHPQMQSGKGTTFDEAD